MQSLAVAPAAPRWELDLNFEYGGLYLGSYTWVLDMSEFETVARVVRWTVWIGFFLGLMTATGRFIQW